MEDRGFLDLMYQQWTKTTQAQNSFWMPEDSYSATEPGTFNIYAVDEEQSKTLVARGLSEEDADFLTAVHGSIADLIRRMHMALDEADRLDLLVDEQTGRIADLERSIDTYESEADRLNARIQHLEDQL